MNPDIFHWAECVGNVLKDRDQSVTCAESCTGGGLSYAFTSVAGSSGWFSQGLVTYSNQSKTQWVGVRSETLAQFGAVSEAVALEMALGAREIAGADHAIAISGIAGPDGGRADKPVGTVCFAWADAHGGVASTKVFAGDRHQVREQSILFALEGLFSRLS